MRVRRSLVISFLHSNVNTAAMFIVAMFLARWLTPAQIGTFSICVGLLNLASVFRDLGAQSYLVQRVDLQPGEAGSVLGLLTCTSWGLAVALWFTAPLFASYFSQPEMTKILRILTLSFLLVPMAGVISALLTRELRAETSAIIGFSGTVGFCAVALTLAANGFGAQTLAWANVANVGVTVVGCWIFRPRGLSLRPAFQGWNRIVKYGGGVVANSLANVANQSVPDLLIGRTLSSHSVGVYSRGNGLVGLYQQVILPTLNYNVMPYVAHSGNTREEMAHQLSKAGAYLSVTAWPVYAFLAVFAEPVLGLLYGPQWTEAAPLVAILCLAGVIKSPVMHLGLALQAMDRSWAAAVPNIAALVTRVLAVLVVRPNELAGLVWCLVAGDLIGTALTTVLARRHLGLQYQALIGHHSRSALVAGGCLAVSLLLTSTTASMSPIAAMLTAAPLIAATWLALIFLTRHSCTEEISKILGRLRSA